MDLNVLSAFSACTLSVCVVEVAHLLLDLSKDCICHELIHLIFMYLCSSIGQESAVVQPSSPFRVPKLSQSLAP